MSGRTRSAKAKTLQTTLTSQLRRSSVPTIPVAQVEDIEQPRPEGMASGGDFTSVLNKIFEKLEGLSKQVSDQSDKIDQNTASINNLTQQVNLNAQTIGKLVEDTTANRKIAEEAKQKVEEVQGEIKPMRKQIGEHQALLSMIELKNKENNLRIRSVPEIDNENLTEYLTKEFTQFWPLEEEKDFKIVSAFRLGKGGRKIKSRDCLISLRTREERDKILSAHFKTPLEIQESRLEIYKDIPKHLLELRVNYGDLVQLLRSNRIIFRWEFPQGISFTFRGKKVKIKSVEDKDKFLNDYGEDLQKGIEEPSDPGSGSSSLIPAPGELKDPKDTPLLGATGGK